jgi:shikimate kinase
MKKILLIGLPGSGKTTLSKKLGGIDIDDILAGEYENLGEFIKNNFNNGEDFLIKEGEVVRNTLENTNSKIIASGGSIVHDIKTIEYIRKNYNNTYVVWLHNEDLTRGTNEEQRGVVYPVGVSNRSELIKLRIPLYASIAQYLIRTDLVNENECIEILKEIMKDFE